MIDRGCVVACFAAVVIGSLEVTDAALPVPIPDTADYSNYCEWSNVVNAASPTYLCFRRGLCLVGKLPPLDANTSANADAGDPAAMLLLGNDAISRGNTVAGIDWLEKSAAKGSIAAMCELGDIYRIGTIAATDYPQAIHWYHRALERGSSLAMMRLSGMYGVGQGVDKNADEAARLTILAAQSGNVDAMFVSGAIYAKGIGVQKDAQEAIRWLSKAYEAGKKREAARTLGAIYDTGGLLPEDLKLSFHWYLLAAEAGDGLAMNKVVEMYRDGRGVEKDPAKQAYWEEQLRKTPVNTITVQSRVSPPPLRRVLTPTPSSVDSETNGH